VTVSEISDHDGAERKLEAADFEAADRRLLPGFERRMVSTGDAEIRTLVAGSGPPVLLLHGDPQTHLCWHPVAPRLTDRFTVVLTDLAGRGESRSTAPASAPDLYAKRVQAAQQVAVMQALGHDRFAVVGHDRGARVARRLALDHPDRVSRLAVLDIIPALDFYEATTAEIAQAYYYFFFLTQPKPAPERLIAGDPKGFMGEILTGLSDRAVPYDPGALDLYLRSAARPAMVEAMCDCFRAGYTIDRDHDRQDRAAGRTIECPTLVGWGETGVVGKLFDVRSIWRRWAPEARFLPLPSGHFMPEEVPEPLTAALREFLDAG